jgi:hypothetical protein
MYFVRNGFYNFDSSLLMKAHAWCQQVTLEALHDGLDVVVSNTFCQRWEMAPYEKMAVKVGAKLQVIVQEIEYESLHVDRSVVERMRARWER